MHTSRLSSLARANLRFHRNGFVAVFVTVFSAALLVCALGVLLDSGIRGGATPHRFAGADVVVGAPQSLDTKEDFDRPFVERSLLPASAVDELSRISDVRSAVGDINVPLSGDDGQLFDAHGWSSAALAPYELKAGHQPTNADEVVTTDPATLGTAVTLRHGGTEDEYTVVGIAASPSPEPTTRTPTIFLEDARAQELWPHPGNVAAIGLIGHDGVGASALAAQVRSNLADIDAETYTGDARADAEYIDVGAARGELTALSSSLAGVALMIAVFVVSSTVSLSVQQRRRDFALLRSMGATPRQIHRLIGSEVWAIGTVAALLGIAPGYVLAQFIRDRFAGAGILPADFALTFGPLPAVAGVVTAVIAARLAAAISARRPARLDPIEALRESAVERAGIGRTRMVFGVLTGLGGVAAASAPVFVPGPAALAGVGSSAILLIVAVALLGPAIVSAAFRVIAAPMQRSSSAATVLAATNLSANGSRLAVAITPMALLIAFGCVQLGAQGTMTAAAQQQSESGMVADLIVTSPGGIEPEVAETIASIDAVEAANPVSRSQALHTSRSTDDPTTEAYAVQGIDPRASATTLDLDVRNGDLTDLRPGTVALSRDAAAAMNVDIGDTVPLRLGDGTLVTPAVIATYKRGLAFGDITLDASEVRRHTTTGLADHLLVSAGSNQITQVRQAMESLGGLTVMDGSEFAVANRQEQRTQDTVNVVVLSVLLGFLGIAVVNTLVQMTADRRREFTLFRLVGARTAQVRGMIHRESLIAVALAAIIGTIAAYPSLAGFAIAVSGGPFPTLSPVAFGVIVGGTCLIGFGATAVSAWKVFHHDRVGA